MKVIFGLAALFVWAFPPGSAFAADIAGQWSGSGYAQFTNGKRERFRCRVTYDRQTSKVFGVFALCASPSARILQRGTVLKATANTYVGNLHNPEFNVSARVRIVVSGSRQTVTIRASEGSGRLSLRR